jgi:phosphate transport system substrate-binding protein
MMFLRQINQKLSFVILVTVVAAFFQYDLFPPISAVAAPAAKEISVEGTIRISGAWALYPMMVTWAEEFKKIHPQVRIDVSAGGAGKGVTDALTGLVDIGMVSRELRPEEIKQNTFYVPVVKDAVFPTINSGNPVLKEIFQKGLKKKALQDMWVSGKDMTWGELTGITNNQKIRVYTRSDSCGAAETWAKYLGAKQEDLKGVAVYGDPGVAEAVRKDKTGVGYNNLNYAYDMKTGQPLAGLQVAPIDVNENGRVDAGERLRTKQEAIRAVLSGSYPSPPARDLYLVAKDSFQGASKVFVHWILTDGQKYVEEVGYLKISAKQIKDALDKTGK